MHQNTLDFMTKQNLNPVIDKTFSMDDAIDACRYFASQQHVGKVVIQL